MESGGFWSTGRLGPSCVCWRKEGRRTGSNACLCTPGGIRVAGAALEARRGPSSSFLVPCSHSSFGAGINSLFFSLFFFTLHTHTCMTGPRNTRDEQLLGGLYV
jgi:hypothetical protein